MPGGGGVFVGSLSLVFIFKYSPVQLREVEPKPSTGKLQMKRLVSFSTSRREIEDRGVCNESRVLSTKC